jgi:hypothetical protein
MLTGMRCKLTIERRTVDAEVLIASDNRHSLMLTFDAGLWVAGGVYPGRIALRWDPDARTYRDLMTGTPCNIDWLCAKCNQQFSMGVEVFTLEGECGLMVWDIGKALRIVADPSRREPSPGGVPQVIPDWMMDRLLSVNAEFTPEHLEHVDPTKPGIVAQRFGGMFLLDGTHRAHRARRDGVPFYAHCLTLAESEQCLVRELSDVADMGAEEIAREVRGVLINNRDMGDSFTLELALTDGEDPVAAERAIRAHLSTDENAAIKLEFTRVAGDPTRKV